MGNSLYVLLGFFREMGPFLGCHEFTMCLHSVHHESTQCSPCHQGIRPDCYDICSSSAHDGGRRISLALGPYGKNKPV